MHGKPPFLYAICAVVAVLASGCYLRPEPPPEPPDPWTGPFAQPDAKGGTDVVQVRNPQTFPSLKAEVALGNATGQTLTVRVRALRPTVALDCALVAKAPQVALSRGLFAPAHTWVVQSGRAFDPLAGQSLPAKSACRALLVDGSGFSMRLLFWLGADHPVTSLPSTVQGQPEGRLVALVPAESGVQFAKHPVVFFAPPQVAPGPVPGCEVAPETASLAWSEPVPLGDQTVITVQSAPDGCHFLELLAKTGVQPWYVCLPGTALPFGEGDAVFVAALQGGHDLGAVQGFEVLADAGKLRFGRGEDVVYFGKGDADIAPIPGCGGAHDGCGQWLQPLAVTVDAAGKTTALAAGQTLGLGDGATLTVLRAEATPVVDTACQPGGAVGKRRVESVYVQAK